MRAEPGQRARRALAHLLGADDGRHGQVPRASSCAPTTTARAASSRCSRSCRQRLRAGGRGGIGCARRSLVVFGAALLYGDGIITPAISVLARVEGLEVADARARSRCVVPLTVRRARRALRRSSGAAPAGIGAHLRAGDGRCGSRTHRACSGAVPDRRGTRRCSPRSRPPTPCAFFAARTACTGFVVLGSVVLAVTGGEALYADMGHFGARPDPPRLARARLAGARAQLLRPGRAPPARPRARATNPFFAHGAARARSPTRSSRSPRRRRSSPRRRSSRAPSRSRTRRCSSASSRASRSATPRARPRGRSTSPEMNWVARRRVRGAGARVPGVERARGGVRHRRHRHDGHHVSVVLLRGRAQDVEVAAVEGAAAARRCSSLRPAVLRANLLKFIDGGYVPILVAAIVFAVMIVWRRGRVVLLAPHRARRARRGALPRRSRSATTCARVARHRRLSHGAAMRRAGGAGALSSATCTRCPRASSLLARHSSGCRACRSPTASRSRPRSHGFYRITVRAGFMERPDARAAARRAGASRPASTRPTSPTSSAARPSSRPTRARWAAAAESLLPLPLRCRLERHDLLRPAARPGHGGRHARRSLTLSQRSKRSPRPRRRCPPARTARPRRCARPGRPRRTAAP